MTCGIYLLTFADNAHYVGQSISIEDRYQGHLRSFLNGKCSQKMLQAYQKYGNPILTILLECIEEELDSNENLAIEIFDAVNSGLNTLEHAEDMPKWKSLLKGEDTGSSVYSNAEILEVVKLMTKPDLTLLEVASITKINYATVRKISQGIQHLWVAEQYPELYSKMMEVRELRNKTTWSKHGEKIKHKFTAEAQGIVYPEVLSPTGQKYNITNLTEFCSLHDLQRSNFRKVLQGKRGSHKGWTIVK